MEIGILVGVADTYRPFTRADASAFGITPRRLSGSRFRRIFRGVYIDAAVAPTHRERAVAGLLLHPKGAWASHTTAARVYGVAVPDDSLVHISVTDPKDRRWQPGLKAHVAPVGTESITLHGIRVSGPIRLFIELASVLDLVDLVVAGEALIRVFGITLAELHAALERTREYWSGAARVAARYLREGVDSPMESRLRMLLILAGLPEPHINFRVRDVDGQVLVRFDLSYPDLKIAIEYDGRHHVEVQDQWNADLERREFTDDLDWRTIKVTAAGIYQHPARTIARVAYAIRRRGGFVPPRSDAWRPYFPGRPAAA